MRYETEDEAIAAQFAAGERRRVSVVQHISAEVVLSNRDMVLSTIIPNMRAKLAAKLAQDRLRPVDRWPAVQVGRYVWTSDNQAGGPNAPLGMREMHLDELEAKRLPSVYVLELSTDAVPDPQQADL